MLSSAEVREAVESAERRFVDACATATDDEWRFKPVGEGNRAWSVPQVVEHVIGANEGVLRLLRDVIVTSPRGDQRRDFEDEEMPYLFYGGGGAVPPGLEAPAGRLTNKDEALDAFRWSADAILDWYDGTGSDLREHALRHPAFGLFDGAQWLLFAAVHMRQHRGQILDVKIECNTADAAHLHRVHHVALAVSDANAADLFYRDVLGLTPVERPEGSRADGSWFQLGNAQVHLFEPGGEGVAPPHFAIEVGDLAAAVAAIRNRGVTVYDTEHLPGFGYQAFLQDPSGNLIELNQAD